MLSHKSILMEKNITLYSGSPSTQTTTYNMKKDIEMNTKKRLLIICKKKKNYTNLNLEEKLNGALSVKFNIMIISNTSAKTNTLIVWNLINSLMKLIKSQNNTLTKKDKSMHNYKQKQLVKKYLTKKTSQLH
jgi:hypothetical protein